MTAQFDPERSAGIRDLLIDTDAARRRRPRVGLVVGMLLTGAVVGAGASTAAFAATGGFSTPAISQPSGQPRPELPPAVDAPAGTVPGSSLVSLIGGPTVLTLTAPTEHPLTDRPAGATHVRVTISALTPGAVSWGTARGDDGMRASFGPSDIGPAAGTTWYDFPLDGSTPTFFLSPSDGFTASVSFQYLNQTPTHLNRNANGQTYGVEGGPDGVPDLIAVVAITPDGAQAEGYARASELNAFSPDRPEQPTTPEEALAWQEERERKYPHGWDIPVFQSDGTTQIGTFHIG